MDWMGIILIVVVIGGILAFGIFKLNQWAALKMSEQDSVIANTKQSVSIFVIDKKKDKLKNANLPKVVFEQLPKMQGMMKMPLVKAKVGNQILTLIADKNVYEQLPLNKNIRVEIAGIYIVSMQGMKSKQQLKDIKKNIKEREKKK